MFDMPNLAECRGAGDYATALASIEARLQELDTEADGRPFGDAARAEFAALQSARSEARDAKAEIEGRLDYLRSIASDPNKVEKPVVSNRARPERTHVPENIYELAGYRNLSNNEEEMGQALRDGAMKALDRMTFAHPGIRQDIAKENVQRLLDHGDTADHKLARQILGTDSPAYKRALNKYVIHGPINAPFTNEERAAFAMGAVATGGYFVNPELDPTLVPSGAWTSVNAVRATARVEQIVGTNIWKGLTATAVTATRTTEAADATEQAPTLAQPTIQPTKVQGQITLSIETGEDRPNLATEMAILIQEAKDTEEENSFTVGVGAAIAPLTAPIGPLAAHGTAGGYADLHTTGDGTMVVGDIDNLYATLALRHRTRAIWLMSRSVLGAVQDLETDGGRLFGSQAGYPAVGAQFPTPSTGNTGLRIFGNPVYEAPSGPAFGDAADKVLMALYDPSTFCIVDRVGLSVEYIPFLFGAAQGNLVSGQRALYFHYRNSAKPLFTTGGLKLVYT